MTDSGARPMFYTPESVGWETSTSAPSRGELVVVSCRSGDATAAWIAARYRRLLAEAGSEREVPHVPAVDRRFSDGETGVRIERHVAGCDVFLVQALLDPTSPRSIDENYMALLLAATTLRQWGARHVTAILPYLAYTRQDGPTAHEREPTTVRFMADLTLAAGVDRLVTWHPHTELHGFYPGIRVDALDAVPFFEEAFERFRGRDDVIVVAPDAGAAKLVTQVAQALALPSAIAAKTRPRPEEAVTTEIIGDFAGKRTAVVIDDMLGTGGTVDALVRRLAAERGIEAVHLGVSHSLCLEQGLERLLALHDEAGLVDVTVANTIPQSAAWRALPFLRVHSVSETLVRVINRIHHERSVSELFSPPP